MKIFFDDVYCAKPKSSRNSSQEAFIIGKNFKFTGENPLCTGKLLSPVALTPPISDKNEEQKSIPVIKFVQCGDIPIEKNIEEKPNKTEEKIMTTNSLTDYLNLFELP